MSSPVRTSSTRRPSGDAPEAIVAPAQRIARALWGVGAAVLVVHGAHTVLGVGGDTLAAVTSPWTTVAVFALCAVASFARALAYRPERRAWSVLGVGLSLYASGSVCSILAPPGDSAGGFLSAANLLWLSLYPLALLAIALLVRSLHSPARRDLWLDAVIGGLTAASLGAMLISRLVIDPMGAADAAPANMLFAVGDLLAIGFAIGSCGLLGWRAPRSLVVLTVGFALQGLEDSAFLRELMQGTYRPGAWLDSAWLLGLLCVTAAAVWPRPLRGGARDAGRGSQLRYQLLCAMAALVLAVAQPPRGTSLVSVTLATLALAALVARFGFIFRANVATIEAKERSEAHLAQAQRMAAIGSWEWHAADDRVIWSGEQARLHNWEHAEPPPGMQAVLELIEPEDRAQLTAALADWTGIDAPMTVQYRVATPGGARVLQVHGEPLRDADGRPVGLFGTCHDISERLRRAEAERANQAKTEFLSRMSHELRTPLNAILGFGQLLATSRLEDRQRANVDQILTAGSHLLSLINEVLDVSRIESGQISISLEPVELSVVLDEAIAMVAPLASSRGVAIGLDPETTGAWVRADQQRLKQILLNLLTNAIKYNRDEGRVTVRVRTPGDDRVSISVTDTGKGIPPEMLAHLFQPFERLGADAGEVEGTGLGLSLSKGLIEAMHGTIDAESAVGAGSTFTIELGAAAPQGAPATADSRSAPAAGRAKRAVLCIERDASSLKLIERILERRPQVELLSAEPGTAAEALAREQLPDLVLLDLSTPDAAGEEALKRLKADPATGHLPVVTLSSDPAPRDRDRILAQGAHACLTKPIDIPELLRLLDQTLSTPAAIASNLA